MVKNGKRLIFSDDMVEIAINSYRKPLVALLMNFNSVPFV
jgi:hypothetical protein